ncbi:MAG TPA: prephenate dehydrogenase/arogenate dehydrogenase family protein, partial [Actinopolymorphaceae bacterium]
MTDLHPSRRVVVIGTGLMGTSLGLALHRDQARVWLEDRDAAHLRVAVSLAAGTPYDPKDVPADQVDLVVVGVPPRALGAVIADALRRFPTAVVTDLGSVKEPVAREVRERVPEHADRYVGGHPMAGSERSGPLAARADLFEGRAWAITPHAGSASEAVSAVEELAKICGAFGVLLTPAEHDQAVAIVSHVPQVASSVVAGLLTEADEDHLVLAGQGLRDVTRIAAGDPALWAQI